MCAKLRTCALKRLTRRGEGRAIEFRDAHARMPLRCSKRLRGLSPDDAKQQDWMGAVFDSEDLGPLIRDRLESLEVVLAFGRTCRRLREHMRPILLDARFACMHPMPEYASVLAVASGKVRTVKFVHERKGISSAGITTAASMGHVHLLVYLQQLEYPMGMDVAMHAAMGGKLNSLKWLHENRCPMGVNALRMAAWSGEPDCVAFLLKRLGHALVQRGGTGVLRAVRLHAPSTVRGPVRCCGKGAHRVHGGAL